jgi:hypothetical protein
MKLLGVGQAVSFSFHSLDSFMMLYSGLVRSKPIYNSVACNSLNNTDSSKLVLIQRKFASICYNGFLKTIIHVIACMFYAI